MNCDCLNTIPETIILNKHYKGKQVTKAKIKETSFQFSAKGVKQFTCSTLECEIIDRRSPVKVTLAHSYCPFCGTKIELEKEDAI